MGAITPFNVFDPNDKLIQNTVQKINLTLRTYTGGYLRFEMMVIWVEKSMANSNFMDVYLL